MKSFKFGDIDIERFGHSSFKISYGLNIYIDPYILPEKFPKADLILVTHEHFDHCETSSIQKLLTPQTKVIAPQDCLNKIIHKNSDVIEPGKKTEFKEIKISTINAYNTNKFRSPGNPFHPKEKNWVGFVIDVGGIKVYHAGDTDLIPEMKKLKNIDVACVPIGGFYTMDDKEAAEAVEKIKPKIVIPMHYNTFENIMKNPKDFASLVKSSEVKILE